MFQGDGGSVESEVWCEIDMLQQAFRRQNAFQAVYAKLDSPQSFDVLRTALANDPRLEVDIRPESDYYAEQSRPLTGLITTAGVFIGVLMGAGAIFAAVNTMYASVASRTREIATLRAIGFGSTSVVCSVLAEAAALAFAGGTRHRRVHGAHAARLLRHRGRCRRRDCRLGQDALTPASPPRTPNTHPPAVATRACSTNGVSTNGGTS